MSDKGKTKWIGLGALACYLAFVTLTSVGAAADMTSFPAILNLFNPHSERLAGEPAWDEAFVFGLHSPKLKSASGTIQDCEIARRVAECGQG